MTPDGTRGHVSWGVAAPHPAATDAAAAILDGGGTAVDAAIAAAGVLAVVYPHNCTIGGDLIALVRADREVPRAVYGVGRSAAGVDVAAMRRRAGEDGSPAPPHSITVPGLVSGWAAMHELGGRLPFARLLAPAIALAADGAPVSHSLARALAGLESDDPGLAGVFGAPGERLGAGEVLVQPRLAATLERLAADPDGFYRGELAQSLAAGLAAAGSAVRAEDLRVHRVAVGDAVAGRGGRLAPRLWTAALPSQGAFFGELVAAVDALVAAGRAVPGRDAPALVGVFAALSSLRDAYLCDPARAVARPTLEQWLGRAGDAAARPAGPLGASAGPAGGSGASPSGDTVAVVVRDVAGRTVSMLQSVFHSFGAQVLDPATGVLFHDRGALFSLRQGAPAELGPRRLPPHTLCPVLVDGPGGTPRVAIATMGGRAQPQILVHVLLRLAAGWDVRDAVAAPRYVVTDAGSDRSGVVVSAEEDLDPEESGALEAAGCDVRTVGKLQDAMGHTQVLQFGGDGTVRGASDPRCDGTAAWGAPRSGAARGARGGAG